MSHLDLSNRNICFLGYGAVAKCTFNHMDRYIKYDIDKVHAVDQFKSAFSGPRVGELKQRVLHVTDANFDALISEIGLVSGDIILDLTYDSCSYYFIQRCLELGLNYVNTSIEDHRDKMQGKSIDCQQRQVQRVVETTMQTHPIRSNILTECGQNPGMIQHYVFHGLREMYRLEHPELASASASSEINAKLDNYDRETLIRVIDECKVGSILCSEVDDQVVDNPPPVEVLTNTWSVSGFLTEALDRAELVRGRDNQWIQPKICPSMLHEDTMKSYEAEQSSDYEVLFMKEQGINLTLATIAPVWQNGSGTARNSDADARLGARSTSRSASLDLSIEAESESVSISPSATTSVRTDPEFSSCTDAHGGVLRHLPFRGKLIHHGEMFELARVFGRKAPFMSYVYSNSEYMDASVKHFYHTHACLGDGVVATAAAVKGPASASTTASATASTDVDTDNDTDSSLSQEASQDAHAHVCNVSSADERIQKAIMAYANQPDTFRVLDQGANGKVWGTDSIGATFVCGKEEVEKLYWCGSLFTDQDEHHAYFTPTTVQVAAGVLSGLSYIMEPEQANRGWFESSDLDTGYMLEKAVPLLGHFFFTEIPMSAWDGDYSIQVTPLI